MNIRRRRGRGVGPIPVPEWTESRNWTESTETYEAKRSALLRWARGQRPRRESKLEAVSFMRWLLARVGAAAEAGRIVVVRRFVGHGAVVAAIPVDVGIEVVTAAECPLGVGGPLVHVADHVVNVKAVGAVAERAARGDGAR